MRHKLWIVGFCVVIAASAFGATMAVALTAASDAPVVGGQQVTKEQDLVRHLAVAPHVPVVDQDGKVRGWLDRDELYSQDAAKPVLVQVHSDAGQVVGYYGNLVGFVEKSVAEAPGFDQLELARQRGLPQASEVTAAQP
jgi:hypothetical protein